MTATKFTLPGDSLEELAANAEYQAGIIAGSSIESLFRVRFCLICFFVIFTVRKRRCGKVMFSQACVKNSVHGGGGVSAPGQTR